MLEQFCTVPTSSGPPYAGVQHRLLYVTAAWAVRGSLVARTLPPTCDPFNAIWSTLRAPHRVAARCVYARAAYLRFTLYTLGRRYEARDKLVNRPGLLWFAAD